LRLPRERRRGFIAGDQVSSLAPKSRRWATKFRRWTTKSRRFSMKLRRFATNSRPFATNSRRSATNSRRFATKFRRSATKRDHFLITKNVILARSGVFSTKWHRRATKFHRFSTKRDHFLITRERGATRPRRGNAALGLCGGPAKMFPRRPSVYGENRHRRPAIPRRRDTPPGPPHCRLQSAHVVRRIITVEPGKRGGQPHRGMWITSTTSFVPGVRNDGEQGRDLRI
jgi:hypothetical protein